jgi:hypothetical protein
MRFGGPARLARTAPGSRFSHAGTAGRARRGNPMYIGIGTVVVIVIIVLIVLMLRRL